MPLIAAQVFTLPTIGKNTLDIFATNRPSLVKSCKPVSGISNLEAVVIYCSFKIDSQPDVLQNFIASYIILSIHLLITYGINLRIFACPF